MYKASSVVLLFTLSLSNELHKIERDSCRKDTTSLSIATQNFISPHEARSGHNLEVNMSMIRKSNTATDTIYRT